MEGRARSRQVRWRRDRSGKGGSAPSFPFLFSAYRAPLSAAAPRVISSNHFSAILRRIRTRR